MNVSDYSYTLQQQDMIVNIFGIFMVIVAVGVIAFIIYSVISR